MLIICSECGKQISDKAEVCIHCGCPVESMNFEHHCSINGVPYDLTDVIRELPNILEKYDSLHSGFIAIMIEKRTPLDVTSSYDLADIILETKKIPATFEGEVKVKSEEKVPKCPTCQSKNISSHVRSMYYKTSFKCNSCGYIW